MFGMSRLFILLQTLLYCIKYGLAFTLNSKPSYTCNYFLRNSQDVDKYDSPSILRSPSIRIKDSMKSLRLWGRNVGSSGSHFDNLRSRVPNILTYLRCLAVPLFLVVFFQAKKNKNILLTTIFIVASLTDYLDGALARRWNVTSPFGAFLDPVADKILTSTALILLSGQYSSLVSIPTTIILAREIGVSALREWMAQSSMRDVVAVGWQGKAKTATTMISITLLLVTTPSQPLLVLNSLGWKLGITLLYLSTILTLTSGFTYFKAAVTLSEK